MATRIKIQKLANRIKERVGMIFLDEINDPRWGFVTVTRVDLSDDLRQCRIFYSVLGSDPDRRRVGRALGDARGYIQTKIAEILKTRTTPIIEFAYDESVEGAIRVTRIIDQLTEERRANEVDAPLQDSDDAGHDANEPRSVADES